jgi:hypothetical protein
MASGAELVTVEAPLIAFDWLINMLGEPARLASVADGKIIIIHLLGLAPAGCLAAPDNGAERLADGSL